MVYPNVSSLSTPTDTRSSGQIGFGGRGIDLFSINQVLKHCLSWRLLIVPFRRWGHNPIEFRNIAQAIRTVLFVGTAATWRWRLCAMSDRPID